MYFHKYVISNNFKSIRINTHRECRPKFFRLHTYEKRVGIPGQSQSNRLSTPKGDVAILVFVYAR